MSHYPIRPDKSAYRNLAFLGDSQLTIIPFARSWSTEHVEIDGSTAIPARIAASLTERIDGVAMV